MFLNNERYCYWGSKYSEWQLNTQDNTGMVYIYNKKKFELLFNPFHACFNKCCNKIYTWPKIKERTTRKALYETLLIYLKIGGLWLSGSFHAPQAANTMHHVSMVVAYTSFSEISRVFILLPMTFNSSSSSRTFLKK